MKLVGKVGDVALLLSGGSPNTDYIFRFQDTTLGKMIVIDAHTDADGAALLQSPPNFGRTGYAVSAMLVTGRVIPFTNGADGDAIIITSTEQTAKPPDSPVA